jgi:menaquinone-9 beta-reductase
MGLRCDALIVGGGPAGLAAAIALRQKGIDVLVADALRPPIEKACGEGLMPDARKDLAALGVPVNGGAPFNGIAFFAGAHSVAANFPQGLGMGIRRIHLHSLLANRCRELGVRIAWGTSIRIAENHPLEVNGQRCTYRYAIGADGLASRMRNAAGLSSGAILTRRYGARAHFRIQPWSSMVEVHWGDEGQAYITPVAEDEVCVATVAADPRWGLEHVLSSLPRLRARLANAAISSRMRGALTTTHRLDRVTNRVTGGEVALVGDASGSVDAVTGEGLGLSFRQAALLAEAVAAGNLEIYEAGYPSLRRIPHLMSRAMLAMDARPGLRQGIMKLLAANPGLFARLLAFHLGAQHIENHATHPDGLLFDPSWQSANRKFGPQPQGQVR